MFFGLHLDHQIRLPGYGPIGPIGPGNAVNTNVKPARESREYSAIC